MSITLTEAQAAQIRAALLDALEMHGGDMEEEDEPGLPDAQRDLEDRLRGAIRLLDRAAEAMS